MYLYVLEKVKQLEDKNFQLETEKEETASQLEEMTNTNKRLQEELKNAKEMIDAIDLHPPSINDSGTLFIILEMFSENFYRYLITFYIDFSFGSHWATVWWFRLLERGVALKSS